MSIYIANDGKAITADSVPNLDDWGWDDYWLAPDWVAWHRLMKAKYGKAQADSTFLLWWNKQSFGATPLDARTFDSSFRKYTTEEGLFDGTWANAAFFSPFLNLFGTVSETANSTVSSAGSAVSTTAKTLKWILPTVFIILVVALLVYLYFKFLKPTIK